MKTRLCTLTLLCICSVPVYMYDLVNYSINKNKETIENFIERETNQKIKLGKIHLSFSNLTVSEVLYTHKNGVINLKNIEVLPNKSFLFGFDPNKLVKKVHIGSVHINPNKKLIFDGNNQEDYSLYLDYIKGMRTLQIDRITYSDILSIDKTYFEKIDEYLYFNTTADYKSNQVNAKGTINLYKALKLNKVDADIFVTSNNIEVKQFNEFFDNPYFILKSGNIQFNEKIQLKDNKVLLSGISEIDNLKISFFNKPIKVNKIKVKNTFGNQKLNLDFLSNIKVNNIPFDIRKISINADTGLKNIKNVTIQSKQLNYHGTFSNKFIENTKHKEIKVKFNIVDLDYFNRLGILEIPQPYNHTIVRNGLFDASFTKDKKNNWHTNYKVTGEASLKVDDNILYEAQGLLEDNKLSLSNFKLNNNPQYGVFNYNLENNDFDLDIKLDVNKPIFEHVKQQYYVPFNINLLNDENIVKLDLKLDHKDHIYTYSGLVYIMGNDVSFNHTNSHYLVTNAKGKIEFSTNTVESFNIQADKITKGLHEFSSVSLNGSYKNNILSSDIETPNLLGRINYDIGLDALKLDMNKAHFSLKDYSKNNIVLTPNNEAQEALPIELPQKIDLFVSDFKIDDISIGSINLGADKQESGKYKIETVLLNDSTELKIDSEVAMAESTIDNNFKLSVDDLRKFNKRYAFEDTIKDGDLQASGTINTSFKDVKFNSIIDNSQGKIELSSKDGEFTKMDSNGSFILNLLSFQTIPNIASLQFGNVFTKNFSYETIDGVLVLNKGNMEIEKLDIKSKISDVNLNGYIDMKEQELNLGLTVTPKVTNSLVFTAVTAASVFNPLFLLGGTILEKIIPLPEVIKYKYKITGNLEYPIISDQNKLDVELPKLD